MRSSILLASPRWIRAKYKITAYAQPSTNGISILSNPSNLLLDEERMLIEPAVDFYSAKPKLLSSLN